MCSRGSAITSVGNCPGSDAGAAAGTMRGRSETYPGVGKCSRCRREYKLRWVDGLIRKHKGLAMVNGSCPYTCDPSCDFACYTALAAAEK